ncbi:MAG: choice-of-anchor D domain-containing protein [Cyclobacteriaceae bacterium]|nr:choice-of-anchor D domain-containing protein [Cyclobacteriaceae bacterium]
MKKILLVFSLSVIGVTKVLSQTPFTAGNLVVVNVNNSNTASLIEYSTSGTVVQTISINPTGPGAHTISYSATSEGALTRSQNGNFLGLAGYRTGTNGSGTDRVISRIAPDGSYNSSSAIPNSEGFTGNNIRGAVFSDDGNRFWASGAGGGGGVRTNSFGATTGSTQVSTTLTNIRTVNIFNNQLYVSSASGAFHGISSVGTGLPTTSGNTITILPGFSTTSGPSNYAFDIAPNGTIIYVADDRATTSGGGLQKWRFDGTNWIHLYTLSSGLTAGLRGLAVDWSATNPIIYATTADASPNKLVTVTDDGSGTSSFTTIATASTNNIFRGVAFAPIKQTVSLGAHSPAGTIYTSTNDVVLMQFKFEATGGNSTIHKLILNQLGTASIGAGNDISNFRLIVDTTNIGTLDASELASPLATGTVSGSTISFTCTPSIVSQGTSVHFFIVGDVSSSGIGNTFIPSIISDKTSFGTNYTTNIAGPGNNWVTIGTPAPTGNTLTIASPGTPTLTISGSLSNFGSVVNGSHSSSQSYSISGTHLMGNVTVTAPANFQVSKDNSVFSSSLTYTAGTDFTLPTLPSQTIYVRFAPNSGTDGVKSGNIEHSSSGAITQNQPVSGTEIGNNPALTVSGTIPFFKPVANGFNSSTSPTFTISGTFLTGNVTITAPPNFQVSKNGTTFSNSITYTAGTDFTLPTLTAQTVYVRFSPTSGTDGIKSGNIACTSPGAATQNVPVGGKEIGNTITSILTIRNAVDANKLPTTTDTVTVQGQLYGINLNQATPASANFQYTIIDATAGISLRKSGSVAVPNMPADHTEGDVYKVSAAVEHFNGLMQLNPFYITRISQGNARKTPTVVTVLNETSESDFVEVQNVSIPNPSQWTGSASNTTPFNVDVVINSVTYVMRIENETELSTKTYSQVFGSTSITSGITIRGLGGQFDTSNPRDGGYQILPYKLTDIIVPAIPEINIKQASTNIASGGNFSMGSVAAGSTGTPVVFTVENLGTASLNLSGTPKVAISGANASEFTINQTSTSATISPGSSTTFTVTFSPVSAGSKTATLTIANNDSDEGSYTINLTGTATSPSTSTFSADVTLKNISLYPNPSNGYITLENINQPITLYVLNALGETQAEFQIEDSQTLDLSNLSKGVYFLHLRNQDHGHIVKKVVIR